MRAVGEAVAEFDGAGGGRPRAAGGAAQEFFGRRARGLARQVGGPRGPAHAPELVNHLQRAPRGTDVGAQTPVQERAEGDEQDDEQEVFQTCPFESANLTRSVARSRVTVRCARTASAGSRRPPRLTFSRRLRQFSLAPAGRLVRLALKVGAQARQLRVGGVDRLQLFEPAACLFSLADRDERGGQRL